MIQNYKQQPDNSMATKRYRYTQVIGLIPFLLSTMINLQVLYLQC